MRELRQMRWACGPRPDRVVCGIKPRLTILDADYGIDWQAVVKRCTACENTDDSLCSSEDTENGEFPLLCVLGQKPGSGSSQHVACCHGLLC